MNDSFKYSAFYLFLEKNSFPRQRARCPQNDKINSQQVGDCENASGWGSLPHRTDLSECDVCLRMLEEQKVWKREADFDRIEIISEMHAQRLHVGFDSEQLYTGRYNPRWSHTPEEHKIDRDVEIERLRLEILLSQPAPSPRDD